MTDSPESDAEAAEDLYDQFSEWYARTCGYNLHVGYWHDENDRASWERATRQLTEQMIRRLDPRPGQRVLDVGCGMGEPALGLAAAHDVEVVGISVSRRQVEVANARAREAELADRVRFEHNDVANLPYLDLSFDGAWFFESLIHIPDKSRALTEVARVLRPGSRVALSDMIHEPDQDWSADLQDMITLLGIDDYAPLCAEAGLTLLDIEDVTPHVIMPEAVDAAMRSEMLAKRDELVAIVGEEMAHRFVDPEEGAFCKASGGYVLLSARRN